MARSHARRHGAQASHVYRHAVRGDAATMSAQQAQAPQTDNSVRFVAPDQPFVATAPKVDFDPPPGQTPPEPVGNEHGQSARRGHRRAVHRSGACAGLTPAQIVQKVVDDAAYNTTNPGYGFAGDPLHSPDPAKYYGFLVRAALY